MPSRRTALHALAAFVLLGCSINVEQPRLNPQRMDWIGVNAQGVSFRVTFAAYNPNTFELPLRDLEAELTLAGNATGSSVTNLNTTLPPQREVAVTADVTVPWNGVPGWLATSVTQPVIEYQINGTVTAERYISVRASFSQTGTVDRNFFLGGAVGTINSVINSLLPGAGVQVQ